MGKSNTNGDAKLTREEAIAALTQDRQERERACLEEIKEVLDRHGCVIQAFPTIEGGLIKAIVQVTANG